MFKFYMQQSAPLVLIVIGSALLVVVTLFNRFQRLQLIRMRVDEILNVVESDSSLSSPLPSSATTANLVEQVNSDPATRTNYVAMKASEVAIGSSKHQLQQNSTPSVPASLLRKSVTSKSFDISATSDTEPQSRRSSFFRPPSGSPSRSAPDAFDAENESNSQLCDSAPLFKLSSHSINSIEPSTAVSSSQIQNRSHDSPKSQSAPPRHQLEPSKPPAAARILHVMVRFLWFLYLDTAMRTLTAFSCERQPDFAGIDSDYSAPTSATSLLSFRYDHSLY